MRNTILFIAVIFLISCKSKKEEKAPLPPKLGTAKIIGAPIKRDSTRPIKVLYRTIWADNKYDTLNGKWDVKIDTIVQEEIGTPSKTKDGRDTLLLSYVRVPKDSVDWDVANRDVDSIQKKR